MLIEKRKEQKQLKIVPNKFLGTISITSSIIKLSKFLLDLVGSSRFSWHGFFEHHKLWIFKVLKINVPKIHPKPLKVHWG